MKDKPWVFRCDYCGRFVSHRDLDTGKAICTMLTPDSPFTAETWTTYHRKCRS